MDLYWADASFCLSVFLLVSKWIFLSVVEQSTEPRNSLNYGATLLFHKTENTFLNTYTLKVGAVGSESGEEGLGTSCADAAYFASCLVQIMEGLRPPQQTPTKAKFLSNHRCSAEKEGATSKFLFTLQVYVCITSVASPSFKHADRWV
jgi:hypothetical protein